MRCSAASRRNHEPHPSVIFLDPFGIKGIDWSAVEKLISRRAPTDLWIRFDHLQVRRLDGSYDSDAPSAQRKFEILTRVYGIDDGEHLHGRLRGSTSEERIQNAVNLYLERLAEAYRAFRGTGYGAAYEIKTLYEQSKYCLAFATTSPKGVTLASNIVYSIEEEYQQKVEQTKQRETGQMSLFALAPDVISDAVFENILARLKKDIWCLCRGEEVSRVEIHLRVLPKWFGQIKGRHLTKALEALIDEKRIVTTNSTRLSEDKTLFTFRP